MNRLSPIYEEWDYSICHHRLRICISPGEQNSIRSLPASGDHFSEFYSVTRSFLPQLFELIAFGYPGNESGFFEVVDPEWRRCLRGRLFRIWSDNLQIDCRTQ